MFWMEELKIEIPTDKPSLREILRAAPFAYRLIYRADPRGVILYLFSEISLLPASALSVVAIKRLVDALTTRQPEQAWFWAAVLVMDALFFALSYFIREQQNECVRFKLEAKLAEEQFSYLMRLSYYVLEDPRFQELSALYTRKSYMVIATVNATSALLRSVFTSLGLMTVFVFLPWQAISFLLFSFVLRMFFIQRVRDWSWSVLSMETREGRRALYYEQHMVYPPSLLALRSYGLDRDFFRRWKTLVQKILATRIRLVKVNTRSMVFGDLAEVGGLIVGTLILVAGVLTGQTTVSAAVVFFTTYQQLQSNIGGLANNFTWWVKEASFLPSLKAYLSFSVERDEGKKLPDVPLSLEFRDVWFRYPGRKDYVLRGVTFTFFEGEHIALVGLNGAGKTTLLKLLMRVYEPSRGSILVNGVELSKIRPSAWREALSILPQNVQKYDDLLRKQVLYGDPGTRYNAARFRTAMRVSGLEKVAAEFPRGLKTHAGKHYAMPEDEPIELSGGQNQIVAIARSLYRQARIYVFDEPTAAVDAEKEERFFEALPEVLRSQAVVYVSHRFSTLRRAGRIIVLDRGRVIENGTHDELMTQGGRYAELFTLQAKMYQ